jgi:hypothetical protein
MFRDSVIVPPSSIEPSSDIMTLEDATTDLYRNVATNHPVMWRNITHTQKKETPDLTTVRLQS